MKKLIGLISVMFLGLFLSSAMASETPMENPIEEQTQATSIEDQVQATQEESLSALERFAVWPFESIEKNSAEATENLKMDMTVDVDGKTYFPVQDDESD